VTDDQTVHMIGNLPTSAISMRQEAVRWHLTTMLIRRGLVTEWPCLALDELECAMCEIR
jgi:hypothetical protein